MIPVAYSGNKKVFEGILLSVLSMLKHTEESVHLYVLTMDLTDKDASYEPISVSQIEILDRAVKTANPESLAERIDITELYRETLRHGKNENSDYTPYCLIRLFLDELPQIPDKLIYVDVDTMFPGDVAELWNVDISDYEYGAVLDHMGKFWISATYINSGVLLLNMAEIRRTGLFARARNLVLTKWMKMADQSAINKLAERKLYLPRRFNEQRGIREDTVVKHFCKGIRYFPFFHIYNYKQWNREKVHKKLKIFDFDGIYAEYDELAKIHDLNR